MTNEFLVISAIRFVLPFFLLKWPLSTFIISIIVDTKDFDFLNLKTAEDYAFYQMWDKILDIYFFAFLVAVSLKWKDKIAKRLMIFFFSYRLLGTILFTVFGNRMFLFIFPNFLEILFILYLVFWRLTGSQKFFDSKNSTVLILLAIFIPIIGQEYFMHVSKASPAEVFGTPPLIFARIDWTPWLIAAVIPVFALFWKVRKSRADK